MTFTDDMTLGQARAALRELVDEGHICPCCRQLAKVYRWSLYSTAAHALLLFYRLGAATEYVHSSRLKEHGHKGQGDASRLRLWGLVERDERRREDGGRSGYWRLTDKGLAFAKAETAIPKYVYVYDGRLLKSGGDPVTIRDVLGKNFDYDEIMQPAMMALR